MHNIQRQSRNIIINRRKFAVEYLPLFYKMDGWDRLWISWALLLNEYTELESSFTKRNMSNEIISTIQGILTFAGLCTRKGGNDRRTNIQQRLVFSCILMLYLLFEVASTIYVVRHLKIGDIENSLYAGFQVLAIFSTIGCFLTVGYHKQKVRIIIAEIQKLVDQSILASKQKQFRILENSFFNFMFVAIDTPSAIYFVHADKFSQIFFKYALIGIDGVFFSTSLLFVASGAVYYYKRDGHIEARNLFLPYKLR